MTFVPTQPIKELEKLRIEWYYNTNIMFNIINAIKYRETVFLATARKLTHRFLKINAIRFLQKNFERYGFFDTDKLYNMYHSIAKYPNMPMFSFNWAEKLEQQAKFNLEYVDYITAYDLVFDIDNEDISKAYASATKLKRLFDDYKVSYACIFSGTKGFHLRVPYEHLPEPLKKLGWEELKDLFKVFAYELKIYYDIDDIDMGIYDLKRIIKTPYSVVYPYYYVALPLTDEQFANFKLREVFLPELVTKMDRFRSRGLLVRDGEPDGLLKLMLDVAEKQKYKSQLMKTFKFNKIYLFETINQLKIRGDKR